MIELVSAVSFRKTGIPADRAGDDCRFPPEDLRAGVRRQNRRCEKPGFPTRSRVSPVAVRTREWLAAAADVKLANSRDFRSAAGYSRLSVRDSKRPSPRALTGRRFEHYTVSARYKGFGEKSALQALFGVAGPGRSNSPVQKPWQNRGIFGVRVPEVYKWANWLAEGEELGSNLLRFAKRHPRAKPMATSPKN